MIRLPAIGAAVFALTTLALPTFALTHGAHAGPHHAPRHARAVAGGQSGGGRRDGQRSGRRRGRPADHVVRHRDDRRRHGQRRHAGGQAAVQGRLRVRRRPAEPVRGLAGRAAGQRGDRAAVPVRAGRRHEGAAARHGHQLRRRSTSTSRSCRCPGRARRTPDNFGAIASIVQRALGQRRRAAQRGRAGRRPLRRHAGVRARRDDHGRFRRAVRAPRTFTTAAG